MAVCAKHGSIGCLCPLERIWPFHRVPGHTHAHTYALFLAYGCRSPLCIAVRFGESDYVLISLCDRYYGARSCVSRSGGGPPVSTMVPFFAALCSIAVTTRCSGLRLIHDIITISGHGSDRKLHEDHRDGASARRFPGACDDRWPRKFAICVTCKRTMRHEHDHVCPPVSAAARRLTEYTVHRPHTHALKRSAKSRASHVVNRFLRRPTPLPPAPAPFFA